MKEKIRRLIDYLVDLQKTNPVKFFSIVALLIALLSGITISYSALRAFLKARNMPVPEEIDREFIKQLFKDLKELTQNNSQ